MKLSKNFNLEEFTESATARKLKLSNKPSEDQKKNIQHLVTSVLQPLRDAIGSAITIESGFRSTEVNRAVGGQLKSYHLCQGYYAAADIKAKGVTLEKLMDTLIELDLPVEEAIIEYDQGILHVAARRPQRELLTRTADKNGKLSYQVYSPSSRKKARRSIPVKSRARAKKRSK